MSTFRDRFAQISLAIALGAIMTIEADATVMVPTGPNGTLTAYRVVNAPVTWDTARMQAEQLSFLGSPGHLVVIDSLNESDFLTMNLASGDRWIGLTDATSTSALDGRSFSGAAEFGNTSGLLLPLRDVVPGASQRGQGFVWVTGESFNFPRWNLGEPNAQAGEDGVILHNDGWSDSPAGSSLGQANTSVPSYIVEFDTNLSMTMGSLGPLCGTLS